MAKIVSLADIFTAIQEVLNPKNPNSVRMADKISKHWRGPTAALADALENHPKFRGDGIRVHPNSTRTKTTVQQIFIMMVRKYDDAGWEFEK